MNRTEINVVKAFLCNGLSHRQIQKTVLNKDAPIRGGGFLAMNILHKFGITDRHKSILKGVNFNLEVFLETRNITAYLEAVRSNITVKVSVGSTVKLYDTDTEIEVYYKIVGEHEVNNKLGMISSKSLLGKALIGRELDDSVKIVVPSGVKEYEIMDIT